MCWIIKDVIIFDKQCQVLVIINVFNLVNMIVLFGEFIWMDWFKFDFCVMFYFCFKCFNFYVFQCVFGFGIFMIGLVILVMLSCYDGFGYCQCMFQWQIVKFICGVGVGFFVVVFDGKFIVY